MLTLVAPGPKLIAVRTTQQSAMVQYLTAHFMCEPMAQLGLGVDTTKTLCVLCVIDELAGEQQVVYLGVAQPAEYVLCHLMNGDAQQMITHIRALPPSIVFNSLGEHQPVVDKIQSEFPCECSDWSTLLYKENDEGVIVTFCWKMDQGSANFMTKLCLSGRSLPACWLICASMRPVIWQKPLHPMPGIWWIYGFMTVTRYTICSIKGCSKPFRL